MSVNDYPQGHPLHPVPDAALVAARAVLADGVLYRDVDPEAADPIADAVVVALLPWMDLTPRLRPIDHAGQRTVAMEDACPPEIEHHPNCYQRTGVPDDMPPNICDCRVLRMIDEHANPAGRSGATDD